jgi:hypothetical protein
MAETVAQLAGLNVRPTTHRVSSLDSEPALLRRLDAMTVTAVRDGLPVNYHLPEDTFDNVDPDTVDTAYRFVEAMTRRLIA